MRDVFIGSMIQERYEIVRSVRSGAISTVFEAIDRISEERIAVKVITIPHVEEALVRRIEREIEILGRVQHRNIVECMGSGVLDDGRLYLLLEWLEGEDLADFSRRLPVTLRQALGLILQVAGALDAAHAQGVVHRDIKPANIYLVRPQEGEPLDTRVLDFGVAKMPQASSALTRAGAILGTPSYMAPEQASYATAVDGRADVFSLGVVGYELLTGRLPWEAGTDLARLARILTEQATPVLEHVSTIPEGVASLIDGMIHNVVEARVGSAYEVRRQVEACLRSTADADLDTIFNPQEDSLGALVRAGTVAPAPHPLEGFEGIIEDVSSPPSVIIIPGAQGRAASVVTDSKQLLGLRPDVEHTEMLDILSAPTPDSAIPVDEGADRSVVTAQVLETSPPDPAERPRSSVALDVDEASLAPVVPQPLGEDYQELATLAVDVSRSPSGTGRIFDDQLSFVEATDMRAMFGRYREVDQIKRKTMGPLLFGKRGANLVIGPAGIGKTRIRIEVVRLVLAHPSHPQVMAARPDESMQNQPFSFLQRIVSHHLRLTGDETADRVREKIDQTLPVGVPMRRLFTEAGAPFAGGESVLQQNFKSLFQTMTRSTEATEMSRDDERQRAVLVDLLCDGMGRPSESRDASEASSSEALSHEAEVALLRSDPRLYGEQMRRAFDLLLRVFAKDGLVIIVDDAHNLDHQSAQVLARVLSEGESCVLSVLAFALPNLIDMDKRLPSPLARVRAERIELTPIDPRASRELVRSILKKEIHPDALELLINRAEGNPLYLEQLVRAVKEADVFVEEGGVLGIGEASARDPDRVPPTSAAAVSMRLGQQPRQRQQILGAAAVLGEVFWTEGVAALLNLDLDDAMLELDRLLLDNFVRRRPHSRYAGQTEMEFSHAVIRAVTVSKLKRRTRHEHERAACEYLESVNETSHAVLAAHSSQSGDYELAARQLTNAARDALVRGNLGAAAALADEVLVLSDGFGGPQLRKEVLGLVEETARAAQDWETADDALAALEREAATPEDRAEAVERRARSFVARKKFDEARQHADEARRMYGELEARDGVARVMLIYARACEANADLRSALRAYLSAQSQLEAANIQGRLEVNVGLGRIAAHSGDYRNAGARLTESVDAARALRRVEHLSEAHRELVRIHALLGDYDTATAHLAQLNPLTFEIDDRLMAQVATAWLELERGFVTEAYERVRSVSVLAWAPDSPGRAARHSGVVVGQVLRADIEGELRPDVALLEEQTLRSLEVARSHEPALVCALNAALAEVLRRKGDGAGALRAATEAANHLRAEGALAGDEPECIFWVLARVCKANDARPAYEEAIQHMDSVVSRMERQSRAAYLSRPSSRAIINEARELGIGIEREDDSHRIRVRSQKESK